MFDISIPIVTKKEFLISTFQAGPLKFPEKCFLSMPKWRPIDFVRYCVSAFEKLLSGERDRVCVPVWFCDFDGATVPCCSWDFNKIGSLRIGFNETFRYQNEHLKSLYQRPEDWWKNVAKKHENWLGVTDCRSVANWLDFYQKLVACVDGKLSNRCFSSTGRYFSLTPFMRSDKASVCGLRIPSIDCDLVIDVQPSRISSAAYLEHWRVAMEKLLDEECDAVVLVLEVGAENTVTKWIGVIRKDSKHLDLSAPQNRSLEGCLQLGDSTLTVSLASDVKATVREVTNWATVTIEDAERWVYWAATVLSGISTIDDDPDIFSCSCGIRNLR